MKKAGFEIEFTEDFAERNDPLMWWYPISGDLASAWALKRLAVCRSKHKVGKGGGEGHS